MAVEFSAGFVKGELPVDGRLSRITLGHTGAYLGRYSKFPVRVHSVSFVSPSPVGNAPKAFAGGGG